MTTQRRVSRAALATLSTTVATTVATTLAAAVVLTGLSPTAFAGGFEVPENTTRSIARGGTGAVNKRDPSALYFNPALLPRARGYQLLINANVLSLDLEFQRDDFVYMQGSREVRQSFDPVRNNGGLFTAPFVATSWDAGLDNLTFALGAFGPSAYGRPCFGSMADGGCELEERDAQKTAARNMIVGTDMLVAYFSLGAGYRFDDVLGGSLSLGLTASAAHQRTTFSTVVEANANVVPPWREDPTNEAIFTGRDLSDWAPSGIIGLAYDRGGLRLGASYRPPIRWETEGTAEVVFPDALTAFGAALSDSAVTLRTWQAGSLRLGVGYEGGVHPGRPDEPRFDIEANVVWEDWSRVQFFEVELAGDVELRELADDDGTAPLVPLYPIYQAKHYEDTYSLRLGASYATLPWLTVHGGGYFESGAQPLEYTNVDFVSWERYAGGLGLTLHLPAGLDLDLGYLYVHSPTRTVTTGAVYNQIPMSQCTGPDFKHSACANPGTPPGNPQNNGTWNSSLQIMSMGVTWRY